MIILLSTLMLFDPVEKSFYAATLPDLRLPSNHPGSASTS